jgi:nucleoside phosphorylase
MRNSRRRGSGETSQNVDVLVHLRPSSVAREWAVPVAELEHLAGGQIAEWELAGNYPRFVWKGASRSALLQATETGKVDECLKRAGAPPVLQVDTHDHERLYEWVPDTEFRDPPMQDIDRSSTEGLLRRIDLLLVTVTPIERRAVLSRLWPLPDADAVFTGSLDLVTYRVGQFGRYRAAHVQSTMGSGGSRGAALTTHEAIQRAQPKAVLVLGIAFGASRRKYRLGDVLVAERIAPYELAKVTAEEMHHRGQHLSAGVYLAERFTNRRDDWRHPRGAGFVDVHHGLMLSGEKVIDGQTFRDALLQHYPTAIGGEMEGSGAYAAAERHRTQILLVKGICDWADGHKNDRAQAFAANAAVSLAEHVLSKPDILAELGAQDCGPPRQLAAVIPVIRRGTRSDAMELPSVADAPNHKALPPPPAVKPNAATPVRWREYMREQIPPLFGLTFSEAIWNTGFVATPKHVFLLVTLTKSGMVESFQYADHFLSPDRFQWQSQNRTAQEGKHGQLMLNHVKEGVQVHLFVREGKRSRSGGAAPFVYCGPVSFESWRGERPITVVWKLAEPVPLGLRESLKVDTK